MSLSVLPPPSVFAPRPLQAHVGLNLRLADSSDTLLVRHVGLLRDCVALAQQRWSFKVEAAVVLPDQMHLLCAFWSDRFDVGAALALIRASFARHVPVRRAKLWSDRSEVVGLEESKTALYRSEIESVPVRAGLVRKAADWPFSSAWIETREGAKVPVTSRPRPIQPALRTTAPAP